jgi:cold shock CspA family protein
MVTAEQPLAGSHICYRCLHDRPATPYLSINDLSKCPGRNMKKIPHPTREVAYFVARILAVRQTAGDEIPHLIASIRDTIQTLRGGTARPALRRAVVAVEKRERRPRRAVEPLARLTRRSEPPPAPVMPQLMRRAEVAPVAEPPALETQPMKGGTLRGIVRWFDFNTRQGTLRLPGFGDEVAIDAAALERAGISRLYKGQEIEATVAIENDRVRLVGIALPGRAEPGAHGIFKAGTARRNAKPVIVELKRDAMRRTASRIEAEHILGSGGRHGSAD